MGKRKNQVRLSRPVTEGYKFIQKDAEWLESPSYRDLTVLARCLLEEFLIIYRESRNGSLVLDVRRAAERLGVSDNTALQPFDDLVSHGFIVNTRGAVWRNSKAREWRITCMPANGQEPTDDWRDWRPGQHVRATPRMRKKLIAESPTGRMKNSDNSVVKTETEGEK